MVRRMDVVDVRVTVVVELVVVDDTVVDVPVTLLVVVVDEVHTPHITGHVDLANSPSWLLVSHCALRMYLPQMLSSIAP